VTEPVKVAGRPTFLAGPVLCLLILFWFDLERMAAKMTAGYSRLVHLVFSIPIGAMRAGARLVELLER